MPNPRGRPPLKRGDPSVSVSVRFPSSRLAELQRRAADQRLTGVPDLIRRELARRDMVTADDDENED